MPLLEIEDLTVEFMTGHGSFRAVDGVSLSVEAGDVLAVVGESGSGKSVAMLAVMGLLPKRAQVTAARLAFNGVDLLGLTPRQRRRIIGKDMAMIFQEPMSSLNPCFTVGFQITEALKAHLDMSREERRRRAMYLLSAVGISDVERRLRAFPHQLSGGMNQRVDDRDGAGMPAEAADRRRADHGPRRDHPGPDPRPASPPPEGDGDGAGAHHS